MRNNGGAGVALPHSSGPPAAAAGPASPASAASPSIRCFSRSTFERWMPVSSAMLRIEKPRSSRVAGPAPRPPRFSAPLHPPSGAPVGDREPRLERACVLAVDAAALLDVHLEAR